MLNHIKRNIPSNNWPDYELLDSGNQRKLERFGQYVLSRFEPDAVWEMSLPQMEWRNADAAFHIKKGQQSGTWDFNHQINHDWCISCSALKILLKISKSRHIGIFPEQFPQWVWYEEKIRQRKESPSILNLFAYTGLATLYSLRAGAEVTHVDSSRSVVNWAKQNIEINKLDHLPIRWIVDDAMKFLRKENRRGKHYDGIIMDPPVFGRGPSGEVWKFSKEIKNLFQEAAQLLSQDPLFLICTAYNIQIPTNEIMKVLSASQIANSGYIQSGMLIQKNPFSEKHIIHANYMSWSADPWR